MIILELLTSKLGWAIIIGVAIGIFLTGRCVRYESPKEKLSREIREVQKEF